MRKFFIALALVLACAAQALAAPTWVSIQFCDEGSTTSSAYSCSFTAPAAGDVDIITFDAFANTSTTFTSITGTGITQIDGCCSTNNNGLIGAAWTKTGTSVTINSAGVVNHLVIVNEFSGVNTTTPIDKHTIQTALTNATTCSTSALTPTQSGDLALEYIGNNSDNASPAQGSYATSPAASPYTIEFHNGTLGILTAAGFGVYNGTTAITPTWTWSVGQDQICGFILLNAAPTAAVRPAGWIGG